MTGAGQVRLGDAQIAGPLPDARAVASSTAAGVLCDLLAIWREAGLTEREIAAYVRFLGGQAWSLSSFSVSRPESIRIQPDTIGQRKKR